MKTGYKKIGFLALSILLTSVMLFSCGDTENVLYYDDKDGNIASAMNENMFSYHLSENKTMYLYSMGFDTDSEQFWGISTEEGGKTIGEIATEMVLASGKNIVASDYLYEILKSTTGEEGKKQFADADLQIEKQLDALISELTSSNGGKANLEAYLSGFGVDLKNLREYYKMYYRMNALRGSVSATEEEMKTYFSENYSVVKHILVNTSFRIRDDGSRVSLTEEEKAEKKALAENIMLALSNGENFEELWERYKESDAAGAEKYSEGYFVCEDSAFTPEFEKAALDMQVGEIKAVNSSYGIHIMKKYPTIPEKYNLYSDVREDIETAVEDLLFAQMIGRDSALVKVNEEALAKFSIVSAPILN